MKDFPTWKTDRKSSQHEATSMCISALLQRRVCLTSVPPHNLTLLRMPSGLTARCESNEQQNMPRGNTTVCALKPGRYAECRTIEVVGEVTREGQCVFCN